MGRLYPRMRERPEEFRINYDAPLAEGLVFAGLGGHGCVGSMVYPDSSLYGNHGTLINMDAATDWVWSPELGRWGWKHATNSQYIHGTLSGNVAATPSMTLFSWAFGGVGTSREVIFQLMDASGNAVFALSEYVGDNYPQISWRNVDDSTGYGRCEGKKWPTTTWFAYAAIVNNGTVTAFLSNWGKLAVELRGGVWPTTLKSAHQYMVGYRCGGYKISDCLAWSRALQDAEISALADPSNVDLRVSGVPLILPPRRQFFASVEIPAPTFNPAWAQTVNSYIGLGRT